MINLESPFRLANPEDAHELAELVNIAGEGLPLYVWKGLANDGQDPWEVGRQRQANKALEGKIVVADYGDRAVASLTGYPIGSTPEPISPDTPAIFRPLLELEKQALDSWYINVLATYPEHRGKGMGTKLLELAEQIARNEGLERTSVIVADDNSGARRLYERLGYADVASLPSENEDWEASVDSWALLAKSI